MDIIDVDADLPVVPSTEQDTPHPLTVEGHTLGATPLSTSTAPPSGQSTTGEALTPDVKLAPIRQTREASLAERHMAMIARVDGKVRARHSRIVADIALASRVLDEDTSAWPAAARRVAMDARMSSKEAPMYLQISQRVVDSYKRAELGKTMAAPQLNADIKIYVHNENTVHYRTMDLEEEK